ncbi:MAG: thioredoxin family protein [Bacteroidia bacterium]|nr:thioredoxin family protein [Bacteroidia bacterium]
MEKEAIDYGFYLAKGIDFSSYKENFEKELNGSDENPYKQYLPMNWQRLSRIERTIQLNADLLAAIAAKAGKQNWLVISEHWCGDAAQIVPVLAALAQASAGKINLKLVYRDQNLELMDAHLTNGGRSIPKLLILNESNELQSTWGPRPVEAQDLVVQLKNNPETAANYAEELHKWYAYDKQVKIQEELLKLMKF